jgi:glycosyltransferase involved in cell wall biosynthesis
MNIRTCTPALSVVVPYYNCAEYIGELAERVFALESQLGVIELLIVDDASPDDSETHILQLSKRFDRARYIHLPRNRGQHYATHIGIVEANAQQVVVMDCDLENLPEDIPRLLAGFDQFDCVVGKSHDRSKHTLLRRSARQAYTRLLTFASGINVEELGLGSFSFCALGPRALDFLRMANASSIPISLLLIGSDLTIGATEVTTTENNSRRSSYSLVSNIDVAMRSFLFSGRKIRHLLIRIAIAQFFAVSAVMAYVLTQFIISGSTDGWLSMLILSGVLSFVSTSTLIAVMYVGAVQVERIPTSGFHRQK